MGHTFRRSATITRLLRVVILWSMTVMCVLLLPTLGLSQETAIPGEWRDNSANTQDSTADSFADNIPLPAILVDTKNSGQIGDLVFASVRLDGVILFDVAAARTFADENEQAGASPLDVRIQRIENRLYTFLKERLNSSRDLESLTVTANEVNSELVVQATTETTMNPVSLVTVTDNDTEIYGLTAPEVGAYFAERIDKGLRRAYQERQGVYVRWAMMWIAILTIATILLTLLLYHLCQRNWRHQRQLQQQLRALAAEIVPADDTVTAKERVDQEMSQLSQRNLQQQLNRLRIHFQGMVLIQALIWLFVLSLSLRMFPQTRLMGLLLLNRPIQIGLTWFVILLIRQANWFFTDRLLQFLLQNGEEKSSAKQERLRKRLPTLIDTIRGVVKALLLLVGIVFTVIFLFGPSRFGVFASAGVVGLAASIMFQSSLQDAIAGAMLLWHDAYAVGDIVGVGNSTGQVEKMSLLMTQIRSSDGELISLRNGNIDAVKNHTKEWARIDLTIDVALATDSDKALHLMGQVLGEMRQEPQWRSAILEEPDILAIDRLAHSGITLKIRAKTAPIQQWSVSREFLRRIKQRFNEADIEIGAPQQTVKLRHQEDHQNFP